MQNNPDYTIMRKREMQRKVVQIAKKYLNEGYDDHESEMVMMGPWCMMTVVDAEGHHVDDRIRAFAKEVIEVIRSVDVAELITVPTKQEAKMFLYDIYPESLLPDSVQKYAGDKMDLPGNEEGDDFIDYHAQYLLDWLNGVNTPKMWRGRRITSDGTLMPKEEPEPWPESVKQLEMEIGAD